MLIPQDILILVEDFAPDLGWERNNFAKSDEPLIIGLDEEQLEPLLGNMSLNETSTKQIPADWSTLSVGQSPKERVTAEIRNSGSLTVSPPSRATLSEVVALPTSASGIPLSNTGTVTPLQSSPLNPDATRVQMESSSACVQSMYEKRRRSAGSGSSNNNNNRVDIERIRRGGDVRTTV